MKAFLRKMLALVGLFVNRARLYHLQTFWEVEASEPSWKERVVIICVLESTPEEDASEALHTVVKNWHGSLDAQFTNIENLYSGLQALQPTWGVPMQLMTVLADKVPLLEKAVMKCRERNAGPVDFDIRRSLTKELVDFSLDTARNIVFGAYGQKEITIHDVHRLGFMLMSESGGAHGRAIPNKVQAEAKVQVMDYSNINLVVDKASHEDAGPVTEGWPEGAKTVKVLISDIHGKEVLQLMSAHLHTQIHLPDWVRGKQLVLRAAFLKHVDDEPVYSNEVTFTMPLMIRDITPEQE
jgi:hypothetical protein